MITNITVSIPEYLKWRIVNLAESPKIRFSASHDRLVIVVEVPKFLGKQEFVFVATDLKTMTARLDENPPGLVDWLTKAGIEFRITES